MSNNIPQGYKQSPLGVIPQDWEVRRLGEVCRVNQGLQIPIEKRLTEPSANSYKYITIQYLNSAKNAEYIINPTDSVICCEDDVLMTRTGNTGIVVTNVSGVFHNNFFKINFDRNIISKDFLVPYLRQDKTQHQILVKAGTSTIPDLNHKDFYSIYFPIPPLAEQERIAEVLGTWDEAIDKQSQLVKALERRKRALMQQLLSARKRLPNFSAPWQTVKLGEIGVFLKGKGVPKDKIVSYGNPCLTYGDIYTKFNYVIKNISQFISDDTASESQELIKGDILFAGSGETLQDIGKNVAFMGDTPTYAGGDIIIFRPKIEVDSITLSYILASEDCSKQKYKSGQGHSVVHIYAKDISKLSFNLPPIEEQKAISQILTTADQGIESAKSKLEALLTQKRGLMQQLLTGKKRLKI